MKTSFTPGPWKIQHIKNRPYIFQAEFSNYDKWAIARIQNDEVGDIKANASLIVAAPEMYEILATLLSEYEEHIQITVKTVMKAKEILSKARGELKN